MSGHAALTTTCAVGCGVALHPAAAAGGHTTHPGCDPSIGPVGPVDRWQCWRCLMTGPAFTATYALSMVRIHEIFACPMTAEDEPELLKRLGRRAALSRLYPDEVPALTSRRTPSGRLQAIADGVPPPHPLKRGKPRMPEPPTLAAALALADEGYPVFLLGRTKRPVANCPSCPKAEVDPGHDPEVCPCLTCHGFYAATRDHERIAAMHRVVPGGLLAIRTGDASGVAVVDIDPRNGGRVVPELMPPTRAVRTGSDGWHLYYRHPGGPLSAKLHGYPGIDIKADGGYVVAPPSIHPDTRRPYRRIGDRAVIEMPPPLIAACRPAEPPTVSAATGPTPTTNGRGISSPPALLQAHLDAVARAPEGRRRNVLYGAARGVARMVAAGALSTTDAYAALYAAGRGAGQSDRDIRAAITGGFNAESVASEGIAA